MKALAGCIIPVNGFGLAVWRRLVRLWARVRVRFESPSSLLNLRCADTVK